MASSTAVISDQAAVAWAVDHKVTIGAILGAVAVVEAVVVNGGHDGLSFSGLVLVAVTAGLARWLVGVGVWWNKRRVLLATHSLPAPGPVRTYSDLRQETRRIRYVRKQWGAFCTANGITGVGKIVPKLHTVKGTVNGDLTAVISPGPLGVKGTAGMTAIDRIRSLAPSIAETCGCLEVLVRNTGVGHASVTFLWAEPFARVLPVAEMPVAPPGRIAYGVRRDGKPATIQPGLSVLVSGLTGAGKSGLTWSLLADINRQGIPVDLYASDPKGGIELGAFASRVNDRTADFNVVDYCESADDTKRLIEKVERAMKDRQAAQSDRKWTLADVKEQPLIILVIDECIEVLKKMQTAGPSTDKRRPFNQLMTILSQGRASGVMVIASTQMAQKEVLGDVRDLFAQRLSLAQKTSTATDMVLGDGAEAAGAYCSRINDRPGLGYSYDDRDRGFQMFRAAWCDDDDIKRIAAGQVPDGMDTGAKGEVNRMTAVYRFFNKIGELLYVGITVDLEARWSKHAADKSWWPEVDMFKTLVTWHPSEASARQIEEREIKSRFPRYNKQHNGANPIAARVPAQVQPAPVPAAYFARPPAQPELVAEPSNVATMRRTRQRPAPQAYTTRTRTRKAS